jgi:transposase-like protein
MSDFKGRHFEGEIVLWAVRWYCRYGVSYRDLEQMMGERGVSVDRHGAKQPILSTAHQTP